MSRSLDDPADGVPDEPEDLDDPRLAALVEALARGDAIDWQKAESSAGSAEELEQIRALAAISEVATFHRTWLAEGGITGELDENEEPDDEVPTHWGELEILERVGRGSFGDVYKAREPRLDRIVALKLIRASAKTPEREAETLREGRLLAKVRHPNVATVHGAAGADGRVGFWMEFLEGKNLAEILQDQKRFEPREAAEIGIALCRALAAVHAQGIVHRDVKAQNVVRETDGRIVLTDFGVGRDTALLQSEEPSLSGTPLYLAPELFEGKVPSPASDLYALGVLLYYLVTGEFPITGSSFDELKAAHQVRKRRWLKELRKDLPGTFVAAVERALDRDPEKRVGGVEGMQGALARYLGERPLRRKRIRQTLAIAGTVLIFAVGLFVARERGRKEALEHLAKANRLHSQSKLPEAIEELKIAKRLDPDLVPVYLDLISYQTGLGQYEEASLTGADALKLCSGSFVHDCVLVRAREALRRLDYREALARFSEAEKLVPDVDTEKEIVQIHKNLGQPEQGLGIAAKLADADGVVEVGEWVLALSASNQASEAKKALEVLKRRFANDDYFHWVAGTIEIALGDAKEAEKEFGILATRPGDAGYASAGRLLLAQALMYDFRYDEAKDHLLKAANLEQQEGFSRNDAIRSILLAKCYILTGDPLAATSELRSIFDSQDKKIPTNLKIFRNAALVAFEAGDIDLAKKFSQIVSTFPSRDQSDLSKSFDLELRGELAWRREKDSTRAVQLLEKAKKLRDDPQNNLSLARFHVAQERCDRALPFLRQVVQRRGLIVDDFYTPWVIWNEAVELRDRCAKQIPNQGTRNNPV